MSYRALFEGLLARLKRQRWGASIAKQDTGVQAFADEIVSALSSEAPITLNRPIKIKRNYVGPVFVILDDDAEAINYLMDNGTQTVVPHPSVSAAVADVVTLSETVSAVRS